MHHNEYPAWHYQKERACTQNSNFIAFGGFGGIKPLVLFQGPGRVGAVIVISPEPLCGLFLCLHNGFLDVLDQPFMPDRSIISFYISVQLRLTGLNIKMNAAL